MPHRILIVEDEQDVIAVLRMKLEEEGYLVAEAHDGLEGLARIREEIPDLIVLDIMMPGLDGYSVNLRLKDDPRTARIPVIVMTGKGHMQELLKIRDELSVTEYLEKPFRIALLLEKIREILPREN
ncbi:MAG: response regulator transcription factor [Endomicrobiales bacterium]